MELEYEQVQRAFAAQSRAFLELVDVTEDLSTPTSLGDWDCAVLVGHVSTAIEGLARWLDAPRADLTDEWDAVSWWDGAAAIADVNDDFSKRYAAKRTHQQLREVITAAVRHGNEIVAATSADATLVLPAAGVWCRFDQGVATRVFEMTVHGIDLAQAIGADAEPSPEALDLVVRILDERLDAERPTDLADDMDWLLTATGRADHRDHRLPVIR